MIKEFISCIYLADDDPEDRMIFSEVLYELYPNVELRLIESGTALCEVLFAKKTMPPDILFLNVNMPAKNGFDCLREIREQTGSLRFLKIVMYSSSSNPQTIKLSSELGADLYAVKPSSVDDLRKLIKKVFDINWRSSPGKASILLQYS
jgi:DNA-binding NarL/FixJ family response regulator